MCICPGLMLLYEDLSPEVPQSRVPCTTLDASRPIITKDKEVPRKGTDPEGEESESDEWELIEGRASWT